MLEIAQRIATMPPDIVQLNKRAVHRQMEVMGLRAGIRAGHRAVRARRSTRRLSTTS